MGDLTNMNLESAVCILATACVILAIATIGVAYVVNQLTIRTLASAQLANQNAANLVLIAQQLFSASQGTKNETNN